MTRPINIAVDAVRCAEFSRSPSAITVARRVVATAGKTSPVLDLVARLGGNWYARINKDSLFQLEKPNEKIGMSFDQLPTSLLHADWLTNNEKAQFANLNNPPKKEEALELMDQSVKEKIVALSPSTIQDIQSQIKALLKSGDVSKAWCIAIQLP